MSGDNRIVAGEQRAREGARLYSPSAARNREPILAVLRRHLPERGTVLEIASGTGEHVAHFAAALPHMRFLPGDPDAASRASIASWTSDLANVAPPHALDVTNEGWSGAVKETISAVAAINMLQVAPRAAAKGLFAGASKLLAEGGVLFLYGPFAREGAHTAPANAAFDASLKATNPEWGVRDLDRDILPLAEDYGFALSAVVPMPANNLSVVFRRA
jgi:hypothetical protein